MRQTQSLSLEFSLKGLVMNRSERLQHIIAKAKTLTFYKERLANIDPTAVTPEELSALPFVTRDDLTAHFQDDPNGGFLTDDIVQLHLTPAPGVGRMPEYLTQNDIEWQANAVMTQLKRCGLSPKDRCLVVFSYHMLAGGWLFHEGLLKLGAATLALGPADAEQVVEIAETHGFNVLVSNPSFARKLGEAGGRFEKLIAAGEPFTAVPNYREQVEGALSCKAYDAYGLSETGVVAAETSAQDGLHIVEESCVLEVLDPQTLEPVADGEKGELVVTSLTREGMPILRFRTGDLTLKGSQDGKLHLPRGVFGRTDTMVKVKGVKFYPKELLFILAATEGLNFRKYQVVVSAREDGTDAVTLRVEGEAGTDAADIDTTELGKRIRNATGIGMNEISVEPAVEGEVVVDKRFG